jgi:hypothetical protein
VDQFHKRLRLTLHSFVAAVLRGHGRAELVGGERKQLERDVYAFTCQYDD